MRSLRWLSLASLLLVPACGGEEALPAEEEVTEDPADFGGAGKADSATKSLRFTFLQAGVFSDQGTDPRYVPRLLHYGYVPSASPDWAKITDVAITYGADHRNNEVKITVPAKYRSQYMAYVIQYQASAGGQDRTAVWSHDQYLKLADPSGKFALFPVYNGAGYPFAKECFEISVTNGDGQTARYMGVVEKLFYGYTKATLAEYQANNDVAWEDAFGKAGMVDLVEVGNAHDGGYKGSYRMFTPWVRLPKGKNLAFKLNIHKYGGNCGYGDDTVDQGKTDTQTYFMAGLQ